MPARRWPSRPQPIVLLAKRQRVQRRGGDTLCVDLEVAAQRLARLASSEAVGVWVFTASILSGGSDSGRDRR
jgi:hypothetical protein